MKAKAKYIHQLKHPREECRKPVAVIPYKQWLREQRPIVAVLRPPSKVSAKKDKVAIKYAHNHGVKFALAPEAAYRIAGHVNRFSNKVETVRQFV